jgi:hypothetical protein
MEASLAPAVTTGVRGAGYSSFNVLAGSLAIRCAGRAVAATPGMARIAAVPTGRLVYSDGPVRRVPVPQPGDSP